MERSENFKVNANSLNLSSSDLVSFNICNNISSVQLDDVYDFYDVYDVYDVSGVSNRGLIDDIFKVLNISIDNNDDKTDFIINIPFSTNEDVQ
jgi:hypothetical protein